MTTNDTNLRVLIIDDSALYRKIVRDVLETVPGVEVVGTARNGQIGLEEIAKHQPDVITLDFEMPELDGIGVLRALAGKPEAPAAIMVSAFTASGAESTTKALQEGAFDFILKPATKSMEMSIQQLRRDLTPIVLACKSRRRTKSFAPNRATTPPPVSSMPRPKQVSTGVSGRPDIIGIGVSTGGPQALTQLIPALPADLPCPIVLVQHMPPMFTESLANDLNRRSTLSVTEAKDGQIVRAGEVVIAPGGKQMRIVKTADGPQVQITNDPPERNCKPAVDYLFRSLAEHYGRKTLGVILTGMGDDGTLGCAALKEQGAQVITQDAASCVVYGMPKCVVEAGLADVVLPLNEISGKLVAATKQGAFV